MTARSMSDWCIIFKSAGALKFMRLVPAEYFIPGVLTYEHI